MQPEYFMCLTVLHATCDYVRLHIITFKLHDDIYMIYQSHVNIFTSRLIRLERKKNDFMNMDDFKERRV